MNLTIFVSVPTIRPGFVLLDFYNSAIGSELTETRGSHGVSEMSLQSRLFMANETNMTSASFCLQEKY